MRLFIGIEDSEDLLQDLQQVLDNVRRFDAALSARDGHATVATVSTRTIIRGA